MADDDATFIARWSKRKIDARDEVEVRPDGEPTPKPETAEGEAQALDAAQQSEMVAKLPDIDSLEESSDFAQFMQKGVPQAIRRAALSKLWRLNPVFANLDGLNDYDEDFTSVADVVKKITTHFQVGKGLRANQEKEATAARHRGSSEAAAEEQSSAEDQPPADNQQAIEDSEELPLEQEPPLEQETASIERLPEAPAVTVPSNAPEGGDCAKARSRGAARTRRWGGFEA